MKWICILFFSCFLSCQNKSEKNLALLGIENKLAQEWLYANQIQDIKFNGEVFLRPPGVSQLIFRLILPSEGGIHFKTHCVYYQVPYKEIPGVMAVEEIKMKKTCPDAASQNAWIEINHIKDLKVTFENFKLSFEFSQEGKKISWIFLLPNIVNGIIHEKYQAPKERKIYSGLTFLRMGQESLANQNNKYLGKLSDRFSQGSSIRCHQVDKNCQDIGDNRCDDCAYGWYQVVDYQCPQGGSKFCGQNHCGEKNEPACPRGTKVVESEELGICQNDLTSSWNTDHILICL